MADSDVVSISSNDPDESPAGVTVNVLGLCGDVNGDSGVNLFDYITLRAYVLGAPGWTVESNWAADVNGDSGVNLFDYITLRAYVLGAPGWELNCSSREFDKKGGKEEWKEEVERKSAAEGRII